MKVVVITGSTHGIGFGLVRSFLDLGCAVVINGRSQQAVDKAIQVLASEYDQSRLFGFPCDVTDHIQVQSLWDAACAHFGHVDIWINNAGIGQDNRAFVEMSPEEIQAIVNINLLGMMNGSHVAAQGMLAQGSGQIYNMEGFGSDGSIQSRLGVYGATKYALRYFTKSLVKELNNTPVQVGRLSPGMVTTDLLLGSYAAQPERLERVKRIFNILADRVETVAPFLASNILSNQKSGAFIEWLTRRKILWRFLSSPFHHRHVIE